LGQSRHDGLRRRAHGGAMAFAAVAIMHCTPQPPILNGPCERMVTLGPSITELVAAVGAEGRLVGVSRYDDYPASVMRLPRVGGLIDPDIEVIAALEPDCVLHIGGNGSLAPLLAPLARLGIRVRKIDIEALADIGPAALAIGRLTGDRDQASGVARRIEDKLALFSGGPFFKAHGQSALFLYGMRPLVAAGPGSYGHELLTLAGLANITVGSAYPMVDIEYILAKRPSFIFNAAGSESGYEIERLVALGGSRVIAIDDEALLRPTVRSLAAWCAILAMLDEEGAKRDCQQFEVSSP
jgi:iron complex transport system substrate-binding protein